MAGRKYAQDYTLEETVLPGGKRTQRRVYRGTAYRFRQPPQVIRRLRRRIFLAVAAVLLLLLPLLMDNTALSRTVYIVLPAALSLAPLFLLAAGAWRLGFSGDPFTREHRDKTQRRIAGSCCWLAGLLGAACIGTWVRGWRAGEIFPVCCLHGALAVSVVLLPQRKKAAAIPII